MDRDLRRQTIQSMLAQRAGVAAPPGAIAEAMLGTWDQLAGRLVPVIGARGVDALFGRALHLTSKAFPSFMEYAAGAASPASVISRIAAREPVEAAAGGQELLVAFIELLSTLIGESLTERLLAPLWAGPPPVAEAEVGP